MKAERALIEKTLRQVHWNRRKAAQILEVSYKTLLNKIKECGDQPRLTFPWCHFLFPLRSTSAGDS